MASALGGTCLLTERRAAHAGASPSRPPARLHFAPPRSSPLFLSGLANTASGVCRAAHLELHATATLAPQFPSSPESPRHEASASAASANNISPAPPSRLDSTDPQVTTIHSTAEFNSILDQNTEKLVVLMCKARACRPCKMFSRKYSRIADAYKDVVFLEVFGDETKDTRSLMIKMQVQVTPTFRLYRQGHCVHSHGGISDTNLTNAVDAHRNPNPQSDISGLATA